MSWHLTPQVIQFLHIDPLQMVVNDFNIMTEFLGKKTTTTLAYLQQAMDGLHELRVSHTTDSKILFKNFNEIQHHLIAAVKEIKA